MVPFVKEIAAATGVTSATVVHGDAPPGRGPSRPPRGRVSTSEALAGLQLARLLASAPRLATVPRGDGRTVIDMPGWRAPEISMAPLRLFLRALGYDARTWGLGTNTGNPERDAALMAVSVAEVAEETGRQVALVGWSLGGVVAREVAREVPDAVSQVVTFGSPVVGGASHTVVANRYTPEEHAHVKALIEKVNRDRPLSVPVTAIFTRRDGVVHWRACIDRWNPGVRHIEVSSSHLGLGIDPDVWQIVGESLAGRG